MVDIKVLDTNYNIVGIIDTYKSFIWIDRYDSPGEFELYTPFDNYIINMCKQNYYLEIENSYHSQIVEDIEVHSDPDEGNYLIIRGRSLDSILDRRIVWTQTTISSGTDHTLVTGINQLLSDAFIKNSLTERIISNFYIKQPETNFVSSAGTPYQIEKTQFTGDQLDTIIQTISQTLGTGYRILFGHQMRRIYDTNTINVWDATSKTWVSRTIEDFDIIFELYKGYDRSYVQSTLPYVVFSPNFDNVINSNYTDSIKEMKNVTLVMGEDQGSTRKRLIVGSGEGLQRRELYTDARDLRSSDYGTAAKYQDAMKQRGVEQLYENARITNYEGEVEAFRSFIYGQDFFLGDTVQIINEYGISGNAQVIEWVRSESDSGVEVYPTFSGIQIINEDTQEDDEGGNS